MMVSRQNGMTLLLEKGAISMPPDSVIRYRKRKGLVDEPISQVSRLSENNGIIQLDFTFVAAGANSKENAIQAELKAKSDDTAAWESLADRCRHPMPVSAMMCEDLVGEIARNNAIINDRVLVPTLEAAIKGDGAKHDTMKWARQSWDMLVDWSYLDDLNLDEEQKNKRWRDIIPKGGYNTIMRISQGWKPKRKTR